MRKKKTIVILCGKYFPNIGAPAGCFLPYIKELAKDNNVIVVCQKTSNVKSNNVHYGIPFYQVSTIYNDLKCLTNDWNLKGKRSFFYRMFSNIIRLVGGIKTLFLFPDQNKWLIKHYINVLKHIDSQKTIDVLISISYPFGAHLAALEYKTHYRTDVKWLTYTTDPYAHNDPVQYNHVICKSRKRKWALDIEKKIFDVADYNIVTSELYSHLIDSFGQSRNKTISFAYILNPSLNESVNNNKSNCHLRAVFAGSLYYDVRNPEMMLLIFSQLPNLDLDLFTLADSNSKTLLEKYKSDNIHTYGFVSRSRYEEILKKESDILVNIGNNVALQSPSKFLELLSTGKPIINFYSLKDSSYKLIENYPLGLNIPNYDFKEEYIDKTQAFVNRVKNVRLNFEQLRELFPNNVFENHVILLHKMIDAD